MRSTGLLKVQMSISSVGFVAFLERFPRNILIAFVTGCLTHALFVNWPLPGFSCLVVGRLRRSLAGDTACSRRLDGLDLVCVSIQACTSPRRCSPHLVFRPGATYESTMAQCVMHDAMRLIREKVEMALCFWCGEGDGALRSVFTWRCLSVWHCPKILGAQKAVTRSAGIGCSLTLTDSFSAVVMTRQNKTEESRRSS
jgi:hypothetical protein